MNRFEHALPDTLEAAASLLESNDEALLLAGGQTLIPTMKQGLSAPEMLVDLARIAPLSRLTATQSGMMIGAMCPHAAVAASAEMQERIPGLAALAGQIGDAQVRNRGTIGGSIANNDPAADYPAACLALGAIIRTNRREIAADDFFLGLFETALEQGEIITAVEFPHCRTSAYIKFRNPASRFALVGVYVARLASSVRVAITGAGRDGVFRWRKAENALGSDFTPEALAGLAIPADDMLADLHAQGDYRAHLANVLARQAVSAILSQ